MAIRAVTFDCWGTLLRDQNMARAFARRVQAVAEASGGRLDEDAARDLLERAWREHHERWVSGAHYGSEGMAQFCVDVLGADNGMVGRLCAAFEDASLEGDVGPVPGSVEILRDLRSRGLRTALVCDTGFSPGRIVRRLLADLGHAEHLEFLAFSNEVGMPKPHAQIFLRALEAIDADAGAAVHVGDLRRTDVAGARALGMRTVRIRAVYDDTPEPELPDADVVIDSYDDLLPALRSFGAEL